MYTELFSTYSVYTNDNTEEKFKYKNHLNINDKEEHSFLLEKTNNKLNDYLNEKFEKKQRNAGIDMKKITGISTNKSNWEINDNNNGYITNLEEDYDKYSTNFNILLNNGFNMKKENYLKKQYADNIITSKSNRNNNIVNKYSNFYNNYRNDPFSLQSNYTISS
tara:strand:- start:2706 stop:3197 length:492 start_codon:yes stop_codon:yes gene_type:complete